MQEEVTQKTIALVIKTAKLDANVLKAAMRMYLNHRRQKAQKTHGKTSVKKPESYPEKSESKSRRYGYPEAGAFESALYLCWIFL